MGQVEFLHALFETGQVRVGPLGGEPPIDSDARMSAAILEVVRNWDAANRLEFPGEAPPLAEPAALRAAERFYRACQFTVYRDVDARTVIQLFAEPVHGPAGRASARGPATAAEHYAVDLVFRFLPELYRLAHRAASADPLCDGLRQWGAEWPLSSVGMPAIGASSGGAAPAAAASAGTAPPEKSLRPAGTVNPVALETICNDGGLLRLYVDRVIARRDESRLADPRVRAAVLQAIGHFDHLAGPLAKTLKSFAAEPAPETASS